MIYIDFIKDKKELLKEEEKEYIKLIKKILIYFRKIFNYITIDKTEYGDILKIQNLKSSTYKKIEKIFKINNVQIVCLSEKLNNNKLIYIKHIVFKDLHWESTHAAGHSTGHTAAHTHTLHTFHHFL